ncbi:hypothetical protein BDW62DRAFT_208397 [Aspergillus aurantiobrunneus]
MSRTTSFLSLFASLLFITTINAYPTPRSSPSMLTNFLKDIQLTNCPFGDTITLPQSTLPAPSEGLSLKSITIGRGTQNYTCVSDTDTDTTTPQATGATATLFDASCLAALGNDNKNSPETQSPLYLLPDLLKTIPLSSVDFLVNILTHSTGQNLAIGQHYFTADGVPFFDLRGRNSSDGSDWIAAEKEDEMNAPPKPGYGVTGDVAWLKLKGVEGGLSEVYRVHTAGGSPPATCEGMSGEFTLDYTSEYWFYG